MTAQPDTAIDLDELTDAIVGSIATAFPVFETVEAYREDRRSLPAPACRGAMSYGVSETDHGICNRRGTG